MAQQCPEKEIGMVDVEMCEETRTDEDAPVGSSLRRSSQMQPETPLRALNCRRKKGLAIKTAGYMGPTRGRPSVRPSGGTSYVIFPVCPNIRFPKYPN